MPNTDNPNELCSTCSALDIYSLFTGPRRTSDSNRGIKPELVTLGTLAAVKSNTQCPFCRLVIHVLYENHHPWWHFTKDEKEPFDISMVECCVLPVSADYEDEMKFVNPSTRDMVATVLRPTLRPLDGLSEYETALVRQYQRGGGIQLLSPDSVDPSRPLLNGYPATSMENNLSLLRTWMNTCVESHGEACQHKRSKNYTFDYPLQVIDVANRILVEIDLTNDEFAALSYVWGSDQLGYVKLRKHFEDSGSLPAEMPQVIEGAVSVCKALSIPYLWVDLYCVDQYDPVKKAAEIRDMGQIYRLAKVTLISGLSRFPDISPGDGLVPSFDSKSLSQKQKVEVVQERKYITTLINLGWQIRSSEWHRRSWTMQEGQFSTRCAYFGGCDVAFVCGKGHWKESFHSGRYGHDANITDIDTTSRGYYLLSAFNWLQDKEWKFDDYQKLLMSYTGRDLSDESDKLNAVAGCLKFIEDMKELRFVWGLPSRDFHYALLWTGENDRPREGFPSWSWAGSHSLQNMCWVYPSKSSFCCLFENEKGNLESQTPELANTELQGTLIEGSQNFTGKFSTITAEQRFAKISILANDNSKITITSEAAHFSLEIFPTAKVEGKLAELIHAKRCPEVPEDFDSTLTTTETVVEAQIEYSTPHDRFRLLDDHGNSYIHKYPRWYDHHPTMKLSFPRTLMGSTLKWLLTDGIELIMILELKSLVEEEGFVPFHHVLCLGLDRRGPVVRRCGFFCLPKSVWEKAKPTVTTVEIG